MKKILIATVCVLSLCLTSCASKEAPVEEAQIEAPQAEAAEAAEENTDNTEDSESSQAEAEDAGNSETEGNAEAAADTDTESAAEEILDSEDFPEPENFDEPDIITLEPVEETEPVEEPAVSEEVEQEEPPVIAEPEPELPTDNVADFSGVEAAENGENSEAEDSSDNDVITSFENGIDITDDDSDSGEEYIEKEEVIIPSRSVTLKKFEYLDITYPGTGWIYMGITDNSKDLTYFGRKLGTKDTQFSLQARAAGTKIVHFYRNDPLTGNYLDDYIEIIILPENGSNKTHIQAPEYKLPVQKKEVPAEVPADTPAESSEETPSTAKVETKSETKVETKTETPAKAQPQKTETKTTTETTAATTTAATEAENEVIVVDPSPALPDSSSLLQEAKVLYNEKEYASALKKLNQFFEYSTDNRDEALYLQGQILEAKSEVRDIKGAIDAYTSLTKNYPASKLWDSANKRIIYLKRFYLEVR